MSSQVACISGESEKIGVAIACVPLTLLQYTILDPVPILCVGCSTVHRRLRFSIVKILENRNGLYQLAGKLRQTASHKTFTSSGSFVIPYSWKYSSMIQSMSSINCSRAVNISRLVFILE